MIEETQNENNPNGNKINFSPAPSSNVINFETSMSEQSKSRILNQANQNLVNSVNYYNTLTSNQFEKTSEKNYTNSEDYSDKSNYKRGDNMQVEAFFEEIKEDMRERENRNEKRFSDLANYTEKRDSQLREELKEREERFSQEAKDREERFMKSVSELQIDFKETKANNKSTMIAIWSLSIATIIGIAAMVITILVTL